VKIWINIGNTTRTGKHPYSTCGYVEIPGAECPICKDLIGLHDKNDGKLIALGARKKGLQDAKKEFPGLEERKYLGPLQVNLPRYQIKHDRYIGTAQCTRCRRDVGQMTVKVDTLFGIEEDNAVLNGRARVY